MPPGVVTVAAALLVVLAACDGAGQDPGPEAQAVPLHAVSGAVDADDQPADGAVEVGFVVVRGATGWVVVHRDAGGTPGPAVGHVHVPEGASEDVVVPLEVDLEPGRYWVVLHVDRGNIGELELPEPDVGVDVLGIPVREEIALLPAPVSS